MTVQMSREVPAVALAPVPVGGTRSRVGHAHVVLPAFNEELSLPPLLTRLASAATDDRLVVWVVDDGSSDGTLEAIRRENARDPGIVAVSRSRDP